MMIIDPYRFDQIIACDPYWASVIALLHFNGVNDQTTMIDETGRLWSRAINSGRLSDTHSLLGATSYDPMTSYIYPTNGSSDFNFGNSIDFCIEFAVYHTSKLIYEVYMSNDYSGWQSGAAMFTLNQYGGELRMDFVTYDWWNAHSGVPEIGIPYELADNTWHRIALTREANVLRMFHNGNLVATTNSYTGNINLGNGGNFTIGTRRINNRCPPAFYNEVRVTRGVARYSASYVPLYVQYPNIICNYPDPYAQYVVSLLRFNETSAGYVVDETGRSWTGSAGGVPDSGGLYGYSRLFGPPPAGSDRILTAQHVDLDMGYGDFTLEFSLYNTVASQVNFATVFGCDRFGWGTEAAVFTYQPGSNSRLDFYVYEHYVVNSTPIITFGYYTPNVWNKYAVVRSGTNIYAFLDGVLVDTETSFTYPINFGRDGMVIGGSRVNSVSYTGKVDEFRLTKGIARYTSNYDAGVTPFPSL